MSDYCYTLICAAIIALLFFWGLADADSEVADTQSAISHEKSAAMEEKL